MTWLRFGYWVFYWTISVQGIDIEFSFQSSFIVFLGLISVKLLFWVFFPKPFPLFLCDLISYVTIEDSHLLKYISDLHLLLILFLTNLEKFVSSWRINATRFCHWLRTKSLTHMLYGTCEDSYVKFSLAFEGCILPFCFFKQGHSPTKWSFNLWVCSLERRLSSLNGIF